MFQFHSLSTADIFVPCGGRPNAIDERNMFLTINNGVPKWRIVIEGANLFFSQGARYVNF